MRSNEKLAVVVNGGASGLGGGSIEYQGSLGCQLVCKHYRIETDRQMR